MLNYHTNLVESRHFDFAPDLPDFRGGAFPRVVRFLVDTSKSLANKASAAEISHSHVIFAPFLFLQSLILLRFQS